MKKLIALALAAALTLSLTACGGSGGTSSSQAAGGGDEPVKITFWYAWTDKIQENNQNLVKQFNETVGKEKGIEVVAEYQGSYTELHQKLQAAHISGSVPAVTVMEIGSIKTFAQNGVIESLSPYIEKDNVDMADFYEGLLTNCKVDNTWYGLPYLRSTPILYLNTTLLEKAGLDPAGPKNWDELATYARTVKEKTGAYGLSMYSYIWTLEAFLKENGTTVLNADETKTNIASPESQEVFKFFQDLKNEDVIRCVAGADSTKISTDYINQNCAMWFSSTADLSLAMQNAKENGFELGTCFIPANKSYGVPTGGCNLIMTTKISDQEKAAAWEFIKWMTSPEQAAYASAYTGYVPSRKTATQTKTIQDLYATTPQFKVALDQLELYGMGRPMNPGYTQAGTEIVAAMDAIWVNGADVATTLQATAEKVDKLLAE